MLLSYVGIHVYKYIEMLVIVFYVAISTFSQIYKIRINIMVD